MGDDPVEQTDSQCRVDPEHHKAEAHHPDRVVEEFPVKAKAAFEHDRQAEGRHKRDPDRKEPRCQRTDDALVFDPRHHDAADDIEQKDDHARPEPGLHATPGQCARTARRAERAIGICLRCGFGKKSEDDRPGEAEGQKRQRDHQDGVQNGAKAAGPGKRFHRAALLMKSGCGG